MGERRKRKTLWDLEEETRHLSEISGRHSWTGKDRHSNHDSGRYHEFSESRTSITRKSRDHSGYPSWESIEEDPVSLRNGNFKNTHEEKEMCGGKRYYEDMSPGFDGMEMNDYIHTRDYDRSHLHRYSGRGRSRSRSRSRTRGRSPSRSYSRGRGRERGQGFSRSRSRSYDNVRDYSRSHSPMGDYRRQSYGWNDRRNTSEKPSQICREFASGSCRRGSQCRFFHPSSASHRDGDLMEDDIAEDWRSRADLSRIPKHSYRRGSGFESWDGISDPYQGEDEQFPNKNRSAIPCKDFVRGKCRWGDSCRFSHHTASDGSFGKGSRNASFDKYGERQLNNTGKPLCKFFVAGKCDRKNCRFSHDDTNLNDRETQPGEVTASASSRDTSKWWNGPTWDDASRQSDTQKSTGWDDVTNTTGTGNTTKLSDSQKSTCWGESTVTNTTGTANATKHSDMQKSTGWDKSIITSTTSTVDTSGEQSDKRGGKSLENEETKWENLEHASTPLNREHQLSLTEKRGNYSRDLGPTESVAKENMADKQEPLMLCSPWLQNQAGTANISGHNQLKESQNVYNEPLQQNFYPVSHIQELHCRTTENKVMNSTSSDVLTDLKETRFPGHPLSCGQSIDLNSGSMFPGHSSISNQSDGPQNTLYPKPPSNGFSADLNVPAAHMVDHSNMQTQTLNNQKAVPSPGLLEGNVPQILTNLFASEHSAQLMNSLVSVDQQFSPVRNPVSLPQRYEHSQTNPAAEFMSSRRMVPPFPDTSGCANIVNTTNAQGNPPAISLDLLSSMGNGKGNTEHSNTELSNHNLAQEAVLDMVLEQSHPLSDSGTEVDDSKEKHPKSPTPRQELVVVKSEVAEGTRVTEAKIKDAQESKQIGIPGGHGKVEEGSGNKDEKGMRLFKNSLVEFVKEILKPKWKEGRMSREVHKVVVKKVVDKISSTIQADHIPKTQEKVDQYMSHSKPKITKLVQAYVDRCRKAES